MLGTVFSILIAAITSFCCSCRGQRRGSTTSSSRAGGEISDKRNELGKTLFSLDGVVSVVMLLPATSLFGGNEDDEIMRTEVLKVGTIAVFEGTEEALQP